MEPPARNSMWRLGYPTPVNYDDNELYCGGRVTQWARNQGQCGVCGDPYHLDRPHETGGKYANDIITRAYTEGDVINVVIHITANHQGYFEFRICPVADPLKEVTHECLDRNVLQIASNPSLPPRYRYKLDKDKNSEIVNYSLVLPPGLTCKRCVLQWKYRTGNTWDKDPDGTYCLGCGPQEEFYNCADVSISSRDSRVNKPTLKIYEKTPHTQSASFTNDVHKQEILNNKLLKFEFLHGNGHEDERFRNLEFSGNEIGMSIDSHFSKISTPNLIRKNVYKDNDRKSKIVELSKFELAKGHRHSVKNVVPYTLFWDRSKQNPIYLPKGNSNDYRIKDTFEKQSNPDNSVLDSDSERRITGKNNLHSYEAMKVYKNNKRAALLFQLQLAKMSQLQSLKNVQGKDDQRISARTPEESQRARLKQTPRERDIGSVLQTLSNAKANNSKLKTHRRHDFKSINNMSQELKNRLFLDNKTHPNSTSYINHMNLNDLKFSGGKYNKKQPVKHFTNNMETKPPYFQKKILGWVLKALRAHKFQSPHSTHSRLHKPYNKAERQQEPVKTKIEREQKFTSSKLRNNGNGNAGKTNINKPNLNSKTNKGSHVNTPFHIVPRDDHMSKNKQQSKKHTENLIHKIVRILLQAKVLDISKLDMEISADGVCKDKNIKTDLQEFKPPQKFEERNLHKDNFEMMSNHGLTDSEYDERNERKVEGKIGTFSISKIRPPTPHALYPYYGRLASLDKNPVEISPYSIGFNKKYSRRNNKNKDVRFDLTDQSVRDSNENSHVDTQKPPRVQKFVNSLGQSQKNRNTMVTSGHSFYPSFVPHSSNPSSRSPFAPPRHYRNSHEASNYHNFNSLPFHKNNLYSHTPSTHRRRRITTSRIDKYINNQPGAPQTQYKMYKPYVRQNDGQNYFRKPQTSLPAKQNLKCKSLVKLGGGMDQWCVDNCNANFCPQSVCICTVQQSNQQSFHQRQIFPAISSYSKSFRQHIGQRNPYTLQGKMDNLESTDPRYFSPALAHNSNFHKRLIFQNNGSPRNHILDVKYPQNYYTNNHYITGSDQTYPPTPDYNNRYFDHDNQININSKNNYQEGLTTANLWYSSDSRNKNPFIINKRNNAKNIKLRQSFSKRPLVYKRLISCKAIGPYKALLHFDQWCNSSCMNSLCPLTLCACQEW